MLRYSTYLFLESIKIITFVQLGNVTIHIIYTDSNEFNSIQFQMYTVSRKSLDKKHFLDI